MRILSSLLARLRRDVSGNVAVTFAIVCVPVIAAVGCGIDYSRNNQMRAKLQSAVDAASVGAVSRTSPAFIAAGSMTGDGPIAVGNDDARKIFNGNMSGTTGYTLNSLTPDVKKAGAVVTATVSFTATVPTMFMSIVGFKTMTLQGSSTAKASMPKYIDFYLLLDNSPSMGVAATPDDVTKMVNNTSDKCAFACHDYNDSNNYYNLAKKLGVTTRIDVLRSATQQLMDKATSTQTYPNQFRMALYDFGAASKTIGLRALFALSANLSSAKTAAGNIDLMGVYGNNDAYTADKDTPFSTVFPAINNEISTPGDGTTGSPLKYLFFVSDGVADESNAACLKAKGERQPLPVAAQSGALHHAEESRHQDRGALHHLSAAADQQMVHGLDRSLQQGPVRSVAKQRDCAEHAGVRVRRILHRGVTHPGNLRGIEEAVRQGGGRRTYRELIEASLQSEACIDRAYALR
ncbi:Flp pilus assembly protein TadG [Bradyrhizobium sp. USDA 4353]